MTDNKLGRLARVDLRDVWESEPGDFTPWLAGAENIKLLGDTIGLELELEAQEKNVGPFKADILCKDTATGNWVLIENQLESTDHTHLGQLLTYAAGLKAVTIVWIARRFTEEHRAALDWLNEITDERFTFFGLEVELWRIGNSEVAPKFNAVCKPNDWSKTVADMATRIEEGELSETRQLQYEFWKGFVEHLHAAETTLRPPSPRAKYWMDFGIGRSGFCISGRVSPQLGKLEAVFAVKADNAEALFQQLEVQKAAIASEYGEPLEWKRADKQRLILVRRDADVGERSRWPEYHSWLASKLEKFHRVMASRVKKLSAEVGTVAADELS